MNSRTLKLKQLLFRSIAAQGFALKYNKLKRKKWSFLRHTNTKIRKEFWFHNPTRSSPSPKRSRIKASFSIKKALIHQGRLFFSLTKTKWLKKSLSSLSKNLKKNKLFRWTKFANLIERKLVVLLIRVNFFDRIRQASTAIKRGEVFVNGKSIFSPHFLVPTGALVHLEGKSRSSVVKLAMHQLELGKKSLMPLQLFRPSFRPRPFLHSRAGNTVKTRTAKTQITQNFITELFFAEDFFLRFSKKQGSKKNFPKKTSCWPTTLPAVDLPSHVQVDFSSMSFCVKTPLKSNFTSITSKQNISPSTLWKI